MKNCVTCGVELHPERAEKYDYCTAPACRPANAKGLTMVAVGVNKSADQFEVLDEATREEMEKGRYHDPRRASYGRREPAASAPAREPARKPARKAPPAARPVARPAKPWTESQEKLALIYNEQGLRPDEIARKLGISRYLATQIVLGARSPRKR